MQLAALLCLAAVSTFAQTQSFQPHPITFDAHILRDYDAGKVSYVESTDRHAGHWTGKGFRFTLLEAQGQGSVRHIWSTHFKEGPYIEWQFFIDGESTPSIAGTLPEIVAAAERLARAPIAAHKVTLFEDKRDYNLYAPIPFEKSIRIEGVQQTDRVGLLFIQIDYRTRDSSLAGLRLRSKRSDDRLELAYEGALPQQPPQPQIKPQAFSEREIQPGERVLLAKPTGPAIIRRMTLDAPLDSPLRLQIRFDNGKGHAVDTPISRYFGLFQGASFSRITPNRGESYLPMPFRDSAEIYLVNEGATPAKAAVSLDIESVAKFDPGWGYFHALHHQSKNTNGHRLHQVMYVRGRGQWLGMSLFKTGHDHGGGDFAVIDGESRTPLFLHGVNGEDYFTFAWFGRGQHQPYAQALSNDEGRYRHHFENPYPFRKSFHMEWGAYPQLQPESVSVWYQDTPDDTTVREDAIGLSEEWEVAGPRPIPLEASAQRTGIFDVLPPIDKLDAGTKFVMEALQESFMAGWLSEWTNGPALNLTYTARHGTKIAGEMNLGGNGHAYLARKRFVAGQAEWLNAWFSHDDPSEVWLNGERIYAESQQFPGFQTRTFPLKIRAGVNELIVKTSNYFNRNFVWAGFGLYLEDSSGNSMRLADLATRGAATPRE